MQKRWIMSLIFATLSTATQSIIVQYVSNLNGSDFKLGYAAAGILFQSLSHFNI